MTKKSILMVDDDEDDHLIFNESLKEVSQPTFCHSLYDGEEALKYLNQAHVLPDFIFLDTNMPRMNGKTLLQEIKKTERLTHIPVIIYTNADPRFGEVEFLGLGASCILQKSGDITVIPRQISYILSGEYLINPIRDFK